MPIEPDCDPVTGCLIWVALLVPALFGAFLIAVAFIYG